MFLTAFLGLVMYIQLLGSATVAMALDYIGSSILGCCVAVLLLVLYWAVSDVVDGVRLGLAQLQAALDKLDKSAPPLPPGHEVEEPLEKAAVSAGGSAGQRVVAFEKESVRRVALLLCHGGPCDTLRRCDACTGCFGFDLCHKYILYLYLYLFLTRAAGALNVRQLAGHVAASADAGGGPSRRTDLWSIAVDGHVDDVAALLDAGAALKVDAKDAIGSTALFYAAEGGRVDVVGVLLAAGANVNAKDVDGRTALHAAAEGGHAEVVRLLRSAGAAVNAADRSRKSALHFAAGGGHLAAVEALLRDAGASVNATNNEGKAALHFAAERGHAKVVEALAAAGAHVNAKDEEGWGPLHCAAACGHVHVVNVLRTAGADERATDDSGKTALDYALGHGFAAVVEALRTSST